MKFIMVMMIAASLFSISAFAAETTTECPMMRESERTNTKANLGSAKPKPAKSKSASAQ